MTQLLKTAAASGDLVAVALNTHGTRAVQKLIETLTNREQVRWPTIAGSVAGEQNDIVRSGAGVVQQLPTAAPTRMDSGRLWGFTTG